MARQSFQTKSLTVMRPTPFAPVASRFFVLGLLILTAVGIVAFLAIERLRDDAAAVVHSHDVLTTLANVEGELAKASASRRGFLIARDSSFITQYVSSRGHAEDLLDDLDSLAADNPAQTARAKQLRRASIQRLDLMKESINAVALGGDRNEELLPTDESARSLRAALNNLGAEEHRLLVERENRAETTQLAADFVISGGFALAFALFYLASRRSARAAMERSEANRLLDERAVELGVANRQLEELLLATSERLHEPLRRIEAGAAAFAPVPADIAGEGDAEAAELARSAQAMRRIVDDLRTYARLARYEPARERVPLAALVANVIDAHAEVIEASGATVHIDGDLPIVVGDATLIEWILTQLVDNALAFVQSDRVAEVRIGATVTGDRVRLSVTDRGPGILRDNQARVFHLFERLGRDDVAGSGIGLPIAQRSAELMGTRVRLESELGEGSTFSIELPLARGAS